MISYFWPSRYPLIDRYKTVLSDFSQEELSYLLELQKIYKGYEAVIQKNVNIFGEKTIFSFFALLGLYIQVKKALSISHSVALDIYDVVASYKYSYIIDDLRIFEENIISLRDLFWENREFNAAFMQEYFDFTIKSQETMDVLIGFLHSPHIEQRVMGKCFLLWVDSNATHSFHQDELKDIFGENYKQIYELRDRYIKVFIQKYATFFNQSLPCGEYNTPSACQNMADELYEILDCALGIASDKLRHIKTISNHYGIKY